MRDILPTVQLEAGENRPSRIIMLIGLCDNPASAEFVVNATLSVRLSNIDFPCHVINILIFKLRKWRE